MTGFAFGHDWPWLGAVAALILLYLLLGTTKLQGDASAVRWRDRSWLAWAAVFAYLAHNIEEYGVDALGRHYEFPIQMGEIFAGADASPPNAFYLAVNLSIVWLALPLAALLAKRHPLVGLAGYSVMAINLLTHVGAFVVVGYNPGLMTAVLLFLPLTIWMTRALFGPGRLPYQGLAVVIFNGGALHAVLMGSLLAFVHGLIPAAALVAIQLANAFLLLAIPWAAEHKLGARLQLSDPRIAR